MHQSLSAPALNDASGGSLEPPVEVHVTINAEKQMRALCDNANCAGYAGTSNKEKNKVHFQIIYSLLSDLKYSLK